MEYKGQYTSCKVFTDDIEPEAVSQVFNFLNSPAFDGCQIRIMPDVHAGAGAVIGFTSTLGDKVVPNVVGVDLGCFTGETRIPLLNGTIATLRSLAETGLPVWVYSLDDHGYIVPGFGFPKKTRVQAELLEVVVSGGEPIRCTPDHEFMRSDGTFVQAQHLKPFDSLMPFYRTYMLRDGYEHVTSRPGTGGWTHKLVADYALGTRPVDSVVHHLDGTWYNNTPENLAYMSSADHSRMHRKMKPVFGTEPFKTKRKTKLERDGYFAPDLLSKKQAVGAQNFRKYMQERPEEFRDAIKGNGRRGAEYLRRWNTGIGRETTPCDICGRPMTKGNMAKHRATHGVGDNHKVLSVTPLSQREDVYCLSVEKHHNFALCAGVFVHNCGVIALNLGHVQPNFEEFDKHIRANVPSGFSVRQSVYPELKAIFCKNLGNAAQWEAFEAQVNAIVEKLELDSGKVWSAVGTLGGGNHFVELDKDVMSADLWLTVHTGSRNFGLKIANYHQHKAVEKMGKRGGLEWLEGEDAQEYLRDARVAQLYARLNRLTILHAISGHPDGRELVESVHNYIGDDNIIRKGAISAKAGERVIIPWNMEAGLIIGTGKGNADWNQSAPHGAGRKMGRGVAKRTLSLDEFETRMKAAGVWSSCIGKDTLDEAPMAYKSADSIRDAIGDTVEIEKTLKPVYNFKAC